MSGGVADAIVIGVVTVVRVAVATIVDDSEGAATETPIVEDSEGATIVS